MANCLTYTFDITDAFSNNNERAIEVLRGAGVIANNLGWQNYLTMTGNPITHSCGYESVAEAICFLIVNNDNVSAMSILNALRNGGTALTQWNQVVTVSTLPTNSRAYVVGFYTHGLVLPYTNQNIIDNPHYFTNKQIGGVRAYRGRGYVGQAVGNVTVVGNTFTQVSDNPNLGDGIILGYFS